jgi:hypothetical protein
MGGWRGLYARRIENAFRGATEILDFIKVMEKQPGRH